MAKSSGLGDGLLIAGYDLSGDIGSLGSISGTVTPLVVTGINKSAFERIGGRRDGAISFTSYFNPATSRAHPRLSTLPRTDVIVSYLRGTTLGNAAANLVAKQVNYDGTRADDGAFTFSVDAQGNAYGIEWGQQLTAGLRTDTAATNGNGVAIDADGVPYLQLPGTSGNTATTPDAAALDIVGDIDLRVKAALDDWTPGAESTLIAKYTATSNQRSYALAVTTGGNLILRWSEDGTVEKTATSSAAVSVSNGAIKWVRATMDVDNGSSNAAIVFYTSDDGSTWTQLGTTQLNGATTSIFASTAVLELGGRTVGTTHLLAGKIFEAQVLSGIAGTSVAHPVATNSALSDATPRTWTVNGTAFLSNHSYFGLQAYLQVTAFTGTDVTVKLQESKDNGSTDSWTDVTGGGFTAVTSGPTTQRIATSATLQVERYLRAVTTTSGGFASLSFSVTVCRNLVSTVF
ncbi:hypothetical protein [Streptomyces sp. YIM S03343]